MDLTIEIVADYARTQVPAVTSNNSWWWWGFSNLIGFSVLRAGKSAGDVFCNPWCTSRPLSHCGDLKGERIDPEMVTSSPLTIFLPTSPKILGKSILPACPAFCRFDHPQSRTFPTIDNHECVLGCRKKTPNSWCHLNFVLSSSVAFFCFSWRHLEFLGGGGAWHEEY